MQRDDAGFLSTLIGDGRALLKLTALALIASGGFATFQAITGSFLPHDVAFLGMTAQQLCVRNGCRIVHFMVHDRVSFGGVLIAIGIIYLWLAEFPLRRGERWAWWALAISGTVGFLSFLAYLGYGYLDTWHGAGTLVLLPLFVWGLVRTRKLATLPVARPAFDYRSRAGRGRILLAAASFGIVAAGLTISTVGVTSVFVPTDLAYMGVTAGELRAFNAHLVPLIAHDRAGFGGALASSGIALMMAALFAAPSRHFRQAMLFAGIAGFASAIGVHPAIGYTTPSHLGPAIVGCIVYAIGLLEAR